MNDFGLLAKLRARDGTPEPPELRDSFTRAEVETMMERAEARCEARIAALTASLPQLVSDAVEAKLRKMANTDRDPCVELPDLSRITKMTIQFFDNAGQKKRARYQLKLWVWTTAKSKHSEDRQGTIGEKLVPIYTPNTAIARKRFGSKLDHVTVDGIKWIGCLMAGKKFFDQAFVIDEDNHLYACLRGQLIDCGLPARTTDRQHWQSFPAGKRPSMMTWHWNVE